VPERPFPRHFFIVKLLKINKSEKINTFALKYDFRKVFPGCHENLP